MRLFDRLLARLLDRWMPLKFDPNAPPPTEAQLARLEDPKNGTITTQDSGFTVTTPKWAAEVKWSETNRIFCCKRDLLTTDLVCIGFSRADDAPFVEVHEEMQGFQQLLKHMKVSLLEAEQGFWTWFMTSPAFDRTATTIWQSDQQRNNVGEPTAAPSPSVGKQKVDEQ